MHQGISQHLNHAYEAFLPSQLFPSNLKPLLMLDSTTPLVASKSLLVGVSQGRSHCCFQPQQAEQEFPPLGLLQGSHRKSQPSRTERGKWRTYLVLHNTRRSSTPS